MALTGPEKRAVLLLGLLFVAAIVAGFATVALYSNLAGSVSPSRLVGGALAVLGLLLLGGEAVRRR